MKNISKEMFIKIYRSFLYFSSLIFSLVILYSVFVWLFPPDVLQFKSVRQVVVNENLQVKSGGVVTIVVDLCKPVDFTIIETNTYIEDGVQWKIALPMNRFGAGCNAIPVNIPIPKEITIGEPLRVRREIVFKISPFSTVKEEWVSEDFVVVP